MDFDIKPIENKCICIKDYHFIGTKTEDSMWFFDGEYFDFHHIKPSINALRGEEPYDGHYHVETEDKSDYMIFSETEFFEYFSSLHFLIEINPPIIVFQ